MVMEMGLENWGVVGAVVPEAVLPKRLFRAWIEDWEFECLHKNDPVAMERLLHKYGGMRWEDKDNDDELFIGDSLEMEFQGGRNGAGWCLIGTKVSDGTTEPWVIDVVLDEIAEFEQPAYMNVEVVVNQTLRGANVQRILEEIQKRKDQAAAKRQRQR